MKETHKSYGVARVARKQYSVKQGLFGSDVKHLDTIALEICEAELDRELSTERISSTDKLIEVEMSVSQFGKLISTPNIYEGVPVTIRYTQQDGVIPKPDFKDLRAKFKSDVDDNIESARSSVESLRKDIERLFNSGKYISKEEKESVLSRVRKVESCFGRDTDFVLKKFDEHVDTVMNELETSFEAYVSRNSYSAGLKSLTEEEK